MTLLGIGLAKQRKAIVTGLASSVQDFSKSIGSEHTEEVMQLVMLNQYFDTLKSFQGCHTVLLPSVNDSKEELMQAVNASFLSKSK